MIKTIAFDLGGVLVTDCRATLYSYIEEVTGVKAEDVMKRFKTGADAVHAGTLDAAVYWRETLGDAVKGLSDERLRGLFVDRYAVTLQQDVIALAEELKKHYRVGLISNTLPEHIAYANTHFPGFYASFDPTVFSCEIGITKPNRGIFEEYLRRAGCKPDEMVFIDDQRAVLPQAQAMGIHCITFTNAENLEKDLKKLGIKF